MKYPAPNECRIWLPVMFYLLFFSPGAEIHLLDDFRLAIESSLLNLSGDHNAFHWDDNPDIFEPEL